MGFVFLGFLAMILFELIVHEEISDDHSAHESPDLIKEMVRTETCKCKGLQIH